MARTSSPVSSRSRSEEITGKPAPGSKFTQLQIGMPMKQVTDIIGEDIPLNIVFEDAHLIVINKPAGLVTHPGAGNYSGTLVNALIHHFKRLSSVSGEDRPGIVHRLDKDTSGLIVLAKNDRAMQWLQKQFKERKVKKIYLALVDGHPPTPSGRVDAPIGRDSSKRKQMAVVSASRGRKSVSEYFTEKGTSVVNNVF